MEIQQALLILEQKPKGVPFIDLTEAQKLVTQGSSEFYWWTSLLNRPGKTFPTSRKIMRNTTLKMTVMTEWRPPFLWNMLEVAC